MRSLKKVVGSEAGERIPVSPAEVIRQEVLSIFDITQDELAQALNVSRLSVNQLANGKRAITAEMAVRLEKVTGITAKTWLNLQTNYDLAKAKQKLELELPSVTALR